MNDLLKNILLWAIIALVFFSVFQSISTNNTNSGEVPYSEFLDMVDAGQVNNVVFQGQKISGLLRSGDKFETYSAETENTALISELRRGKVKIETKAPEQQSLLAHIFISWFPFVLLIGVWIYFMRQMQGGGKGGAMSFGKSKAKLMTEDQVKVTFEDVAGVEEAKEEVSEIVEFLRDPAKFQRLGGMIPRGILMVGQPGTGKTLLAKAIAGEAKVPFFSISGSDFVEMFVGVGASRVRDMFEQAKKHSPCIIFIDEIDAVGRHRGGGHGGGNDEREQTLNQLLVEMDGFEGNEGVIVIAATNRSDVLDKALLRPGRFDRQVVVPLPDIRGREQILKVHMRKVPLAKGVDARVLARGTPGFSGADLANLVNEAALFAARANRRKVSTEEFEKARDKIMMGAERKSMVMSEKEKLMTAYHEAGHAIVGYLMPEHDPVHKVTIIPRGQALGVTHYLPEDDRLSYSKRYMLGRIASAYGGRIAEEITGGPDSVSNGAASDIQHATSIARSMVVNYGMSDDLGPLDFDARDNDALGTRKVSSHTEKLIDAEIKRITSECYDLAFKTLEDNRDILEAMKDALMEYETIDSEQVEDLMKRREVSEPKDWHNDKNDKSDKPSAPSKKSGKKSDKPIGGPAESH